MLTPAGRLLVVAGLIRGGAGELLLAQRVAGKHLAGLWELPGGKLEVGESPERALRRELREELGIDVRRMQRYMRFDHDYAEVQIDFDVYEVLDYAGEPSSCEGQALRWQQPEVMRLDDMPAASWPVIERLRGNGVAR